MAEPNILPIFHFLSLFLLIVHLPHRSNQLDLSQYEALMRIKEQFNFSKNQLSSTTKHEHLCNKSEPAQILTLACYEENITQLHLTGNYWFPHLSHDFSTSALFSNIASLPNLKVLSLVSLGLKGPLPSKIGELSSLEILNMSSNYFEGSIPTEIASLKNLQTLILDHNRFSGQISVWLIPSFPGLSVLSLKNNSFTGSIPDSLPSMKTLRILKLSSNNLSGELYGLANLTNLQILDLEYNNFGPQFPILPQKLVSLVLKKNKFHSVISSDQFNSSFQLQIVDISHNQLVGQLPTSLLSLPSLSFLDISGNKFTGKLARNFSCDGRLEFVNFSENRLSGEMPDCLMTKNRIVLYEGNCFSSSLRRYRNQHPLSFCHSEALAVGISPGNGREQKRSSSYGKAVVASSMVGGIVGAIAIFGLAFVFLKRGIAKNHNKDVGNTVLIIDKASPAYTLQLLKDARYISETMKLGALGIPAYRTFVLGELKEATNNFDARNLIGEGSHGQVYKGWLTDGSAVAIKGLKVKKKQSVQSYTHQLELISKLRHSHLVTAIGHCFECSKDDSTSVSTIFLVFEYVPNGNLRKLISDGQSCQKLSWRQRIAAGIGVARGIQFLHTGIVPGVFSNSLKITDVLLDHDLHVKISKYNLPLFAENRILDESEAAPSSRGSSKGKLGPKLTCQEKNDVYDFGVILLEMIVGRAIISSNDINISKDILSVSLTADSRARRSIVDPSIHKECSDDSLKTLIELCIRCLSNDPYQRPSVEDIIWNLQFAAQVLNMSYRDSPVHAPTN